MVLLPDTSLVQRYFSPGITSGSKQENKYLKILMNNECPWLLSEQPALPPVFFIPGNACAAGVLPLLSLLSAGKPFWRRLRSWAICLPILGKCAARIAEQTRGLSSLIPVTSTSCFVSRSTLTSTVSCLTFPKSFWGMVKPDLICFSPQHWSFLLNSSS